MELTQSYSIANNKSSKSITNETLDKQEEKINLKEFQKLRLPKRAMTIKK